MRHLPLLAPLAVWAAMTLPAYLPFARLEVVVGLLLAGALGLFVHRRPVLGVQLLLVGVPLQLVALAALYRIGLPGEVVRQLGYWKELVVIGVAAAAFSGLARRNRHQFDLVDRLALAYVALGTVYLVVPQLVVFAPIGGTRTFFDRLAGWRGDVLYVLLFVIARHLRPTGDQLRRVLRAVLFSGLLFAGVGALELVASDLWNSISTDVLEVQQYRIDVLGVSPISLPLDDIRSYGAVAGREIVRAGGPMFSFQSFGFFLVVLVGLAAEHLVRGRWRRAFSACGLAMLALLATQTRSAIAGGAVAFAFVLLPRAGVAVVTRVRFAVVAGAALLVAVPLAFGSGLTDRLTVGDAGSDAAHERSYDAGVGAMTRYPLGQGLATGAGTAQTRDLGGFIITENQYLQIGTQLGVGAMSLYVAFFGAAVTSLHRATRASIDLVATATGGARNGLVGLLLAGWYLQVFAQQTVAFVALLLAGIALGAADRERHDPVASTVAAAAR